MYKLKYSGHGLMPALSNGSDIISEMISPKKIKSSQDFGKPLKDRESTFILILSYFLVIPIPEFLRKSWLYPNSTRTQCGIKQTRTFQDTE